MAKYDTELLFGMGALFIALGLYEIVGRGAALLTVGAFSLAGAFCKSITKD